MLYNCTERLTFHQLSSEKGLDLGIDRVPSVGLICPHHESGRKILKQQPPSNF
jgi:hypothetical protein